MSTGADELVAAYLRELEREAARLPWNARMELLEDVRSHIEVALAEMGDSAELADGFGQSGAGDAVGEAREALAEAKTARVREILAALGEPREIIDAAAADEPGVFVPPPGFPTGPMPAYSYVPSGPPYPLGTAEVFAVALLLGGFFLAGIGWIVGLVLLWTSPRWTVREKLVGTSVLPGGLAAPLFFVTMPAGSKSCVDDSSGYHRCTTSGWTMPLWLGVSAAILMVVLPVLTSVFLVRRARQRAGAPSRTDRTISGLVLGVLGAVVAIFLIGAISFAAVGGSGGGASTPTRVEPSAVASYPGAPIPPPSSSESAEPESASSNSTPH